MVIVGLGNPGKEYHETHHNVGFMFVDKIASSYNATFKLEKKHSCDVAQILINGEKHYLLKPLTYMNLSGKAVKSFCDYYKINPNEILVISDDLDLAVSAFRIRKSGGAGGHKGILSIINELGTNEFARLRIGILYALSSLIIPSGVALLRQLSPLNSFPLFSIPKPSTSFFELIALIITSSLMCLGSGSWTIIPHISSSLFNLLTMFNNSSWEMSSLSLINVDLIPI